MRLRTLWSLVLCLALAVPAAAQPVDLAPDRFDFEPELPYDSAIPSPSDELGYEIGTEFTLYAHVVDYFETLAASSDRVTVAPYGETHEGRPLYYAVITSTGNHGNLDQIKATNQELANAPSLSESERQQRMADQPVTVSYSYNIHGNEASSTEAAMQVAYRLAAATDAETQQLLEDVVFVMFPTVNPDGRDRYVYWYKSMKREQVATEQEDIVHDEAWPEGRTNHYWFDLNRDWVWQVHPEMEGLISTYQQFMPQVHADYHEQGYNDHYFTMPGTTPRNPLLPDNYVAYADTFGRANIEAFDEAGVTYFTREAFDFFYPSYGSSYPSVMGAIGMLTEQAGIDAGLAVENDDGYVLTLRQRVFDHYTTSIATLKAAMRNRDGLLQYYVDAHLPSRTKEVETAAYIFPDDGTGYLYDVLEMLRSHDIEIERATESFRASDAMDYRTGDRATRSFEAGSYIVPADQPRHLFVNTLLQRQVTFQDSVMYDMSTWSAPLAYNLETYATERAPDVDTEPVPEAPSVASGVQNPNARYAFVIDWDQRHAPSALSALWNMDYRVRLAHEPFDTGSQQFSAGSLIVLLGRNYEKDDPVGDMQQIAEQTGVEIVGLNTGRMEEGPDLGSESNAPANAQTVAMLVDGPFSTYTSGQIWYLFDQETQWPISRVRASSLAQSATGAYSSYGDVDLNAFDVLILPGAYNLGAVFDSTQREALRDWIERGGTLVATEGSASFFTADGSGFTDVETVPDTTDAVGPYTPYAARADSFGLDQIPGAAMNAPVDATHPLAFGMGDDVYTLKYGSEALVPSPDLQTAGYYARDADDLLVSGYASQKNLKKLAGGAWAATMGMGDGRIVFLVDNTQYRMFWRGPSRMLQNAAMIVPALMD
jgi:hypothetical protein